MKVPRTLKLLTQIQITANSTTGNTEVTTEQQTNTSIVNSPNTSLSDNGNLNSTKNKTVLINMTTSNGSFSNSGYQGSLSPNHNLSTYNNTNSSLSFKTRNTQLKGTNIHVKT